MAQGAGEIWSFFPRVRRKSGLAGVAQILEKQDQVPYSLINL